MTNCLYKETCDLLEGLGFDLQHVLCRVAVLTCHIYKKGHLRLEVIFYQSPVQIRYCLVDEISRAVLFDGYLSTLSAVEFWLTKEAFKTDPFEQSFLTNFATPGTLFPSTATTPTGTRYVQSPRSK